MKRQKNYIQNCSDYFGVVVFLMISCIGTYFINQTFEMNDAFWHIKTGEWILHHGMIDRCVGSWVIGDKPWVAHEWLFGVLIYLIAQVDMCWIIVGCHLLFLLISFLCCRQAGLFTENHNPPTLYWMLVLLPEFLAYAGMTVARPQYISALFVALFCIVLTTSIEKQRYQRLYLLPLITVLWVNIHGGTAMLSYIMTGIVLCCFLAGFIVEDVGRITFSRPDKRLLCHLAITLLLVICANMINPYGWHMLIYPYENMQDATMLSFITEWSAPDAKRPATLVLEILPILLGMIALIQTGKQIKGYQIALFFLFLILFLRSERFFTYLVIIQTCLITPYAFEVQMTGKLFSIQQQKTSQINRWLILVLTGAQILFVTASVTGVQYSQEEMNGVVPERLLSVIQEDCPSHLLNHYNTGGYLMYHDIEVFIDGRYEPYKQQGIMEDYLTIMNPSDQEAYRHREELLEKYQFDAFLLSVGNTALIDYFERNPIRYELLYEDENWLYYTER